MPHDDAKIGSVAGPKVGDVLAGKYRILQNLASGAMGVVFLGEHVFLHRKVAIKVLRPELCSEPDLVSRFEQEARAASSIGDPHIVEVFDLGRTVEGGLFMVMELLSGRALAEILADETQLSIPRAVDLVAQTLAALAAAHRHHIIHRDLKPENIFVVETEARPSFVKLLDFGISKVLAGKAARDQRGTIDGTLLGTPEYMSPELARGEVQNVDARADIYAAGIVLYEALCGCTPFQGPNYNAILAAVLTGRYTSARLLRPDLPAALEDVIRVALSRDREGRFATAQVMRERLLAAATTGEKASSASEIHLPLTVDDPVAPPPLIAPSLGAFVPADVPREVVAEPPPIEIARPTARSASRGTLARPPRPTWTGTWPSLRIAAFALAAVIAIGIGIRYLHRATSSTREAPFVVELAPDGADLVVDGHPASGRTFSLAPGDHILLASAAGYLPRRITFGTRGDAGQITLRLGHLLVPMSPRDLGGARAASHPGAAPAILPDLDAIFAKLQAYKVCLGASDEVYRLRDRLAAARAANHPSGNVFDTAALDECTSLAEHEHPPALADLDAAAHEQARILKDIAWQFYVPSSDQLAAKVREFVVPDEAFRRELVAARVTVEEAELALLGTDGHTTTWLMRRLAIAAEAWAAAGSTAPARLAALDDSDRELRERLAAHPDEPFAIAGSAAFLAAAHDIVTLAHATPAATHAAVAEAANHLIAAFNGLTTN